MLQSSEIIWHKGKVIEVSDKGVKVVIENTSACSECHSRKACLVADKQDKIIEIKEPDENFVQGEEVVVYFERNLGFHALFLGYIIPFLFLFVVLAISYQITKKELFSGILGIFALIPYYLGLYLFRDKVKKSFTFRISKNK